MDKAPWRPAYELTLERSGFLDCVGGWTTVAKLYFINYRENVFVVGRWNGAPSVLDNSDPCMTVVAEFDDLYAALMFAEMEIANGH